MLKPKHTLQSVALHLAKGLEDGDVILDAKPAPGRDAMPPTAAGSKVPNTADEPGSREGLYGAAVAAARANHLDKSSDLFQQYLKLTIMQDDYHGQWRALSRLGWLSLSFDAARAIEHLERALSIARQLNDTQMEAQSLYNLACAYAVSDDSRAAAFLHHAVDAMRRERGLRIDATELIEDLEPVS